MESFEIKESPSKEEEEKCTQNKAESLSSLSPIVSDKI
jgi:hypothetical protein